MSQPFQQRVASMLSVLHRWLMVVRVPGKQQRSCFWCDMKQAIKHAKLLLNSVRLIAQCGCAHLSLARYSRIVRIVVSSKHYFRITPRPRVQWRWRNRIRRMYKSLSDSAFAALLRKNCIFEAAPLPTNAQVCVLPSLLFSHPLSSFSYRAYQ